MREEIQMKNATEVINTYDGSITLQLHLKAFCKAKPQLGSRDRKILNQLVYGYYRRKGNRPHHDAFIVIGAKDHELVHAFYQYWKKIIPNETDLFKGNYFPLEEHISPLLQREAFIKSHLQQPAVFIRCRKQHVLEVLDELNEKQYAFTRNALTVKFTENYPLQEMETFLKGYFEIQDIASQQTALFMHPQKNEAWWDCCCGSGGKSLLLLEQEPQIQLFVSDVRESMLQNLSERFHRCGIDNYNAYVTDLTEMVEEDLLQLPQFNGIIADVSCSGAGTWSRTPEWLTFFTAALLEEHIERQRKILQSVAKQLLQGGKLLLITCSVYSDENEGNVEWCLANLPLKLVKQQYFQFSADGGDTLFCAEMEKI